MWSHVLARAISVTPQTSNGVPPTLTVPIATPGDGISNTHHAPIDGIVTDVSETRIDIRFDVCPV